MSNSLDPDQARHFVGPDLDSNCLQRFTADDTSRQRVNSYQDISCFENSVDLDHVVSHLGLH